jgi:hypothetical protein
MIGPRDLLVMNQSRLKEDSNMRMGKKMSKIPLGSIPYIHYVEILSPEVSVV